MLSESKAQLLAEGSALLGRSLSETALKVLVSLAEEASLETSLEDERAEYGILRVALETELAARSTLEPVLPR